MEPITAISGALILAGPGKLLLDKLVGPSLGAIGDALAAPLVVRVEARRARLKKVLERAGEIVEASGTDVKVLPDRMLIPIFQHAALEDDELLSERWSRLLVRAATSPESVPPVFVSILGDLSPMDARILEAIAALPPTARRNPDGDNAAIAGQVGADEGTFQISRGNLIRLGLVGAPLAENVVTVGTDDYPEQLFLSNLGLHFMEVVRPPH